MPVSPIDARPSTCADCFPHSQLRFGFHTGADRRSDGRRILIVDDDPDVALFIRVNLEGAGLSDVHMAGDGQEGFEKVLALRPDLIITGVMMPRLLGTEMTRRLRSDPRTAETRILMLTARSRPDDRAEGLAAGADLYMTKPFDPAELLHRVRQLLVVAS